MKKILAGAVVASLVLASNAYSAEEPTPQECLGKFVRGTYKVSDHNESTGKRNKLGKKTGTESVAYLNGLPLESAVCTDPNRMTFFSRNWNDQYVGFTFVFLGEQPQQATQQPYQQVGNFYYN